jgi:DNA-binding PadR family transcriptional regulator
MALRREPSVDRLPLSVPVFQILLSLSDQDLHGYALIKDIESRTQGEVRLTASTLYDAVARLLDAGSIQEVASGERGRRRRYRISPTGRALARREAERLNRALRWAREKRLLPSAARHRS